MSRILFMMKYYYNSRTYVTLTFEIWHWPPFDTWPWYLFDLETDLLLPWCFEENITKMYCFDVTWRKNGTSYVRMETNLPISILSVNMLQCVWPRLWYFKVIWFGCVHHMPLHDWCDFRRDMFIISGDTAYWNMEKTPILYNGVFATMETYVTCFWSMDFFASYIA